MRVLVPTGVQKDWPKSGLASTTMTKPAVPVRDEFKHGMDMLRHLALVADKLSNDLEPVHAPIVSPFVPRNHSTGVL